MIRPDRRKYNQWVNAQTLEDFALRYTAPRGRRWGDWTVANTALGAAGFLACEAIGGTITLQFGFANAILAILVATVIFLVVGAPIAINAAREGLDVDLLTRGAGFGYLGSTITSLIYASFTFLLYAVEASIMAAAITIATGLPIALSYVVSALGVVPIALYGMRAITRMQILTQPLWILLQFGPILYVVLFERPALHVWMRSEGVLGAAPLNLIYFGLAISTLLSLLPQIGEQADYLRFMRVPGKKGRLRWWLAVLCGGPGWGLVGGFKLVAGSFLAVLAMMRHQPPGSADSPPVMYLVLFHDMTDSRTAALICMLLFVVACQTKINVTNVYAGSIAWSNFFARLTHAHPGRVVWLVFNAILALLLMEAGVVRTTATLLALYANLASGWIGALSSDLMIAKPLGLSPKGIEFRRAYLYDINPVGVGAMGLSFACSSLALTGMMGTMAEAFAPVLGLAVAFVAAPGIAALTRGRFYIARPPEIFAHETRCVVCAMTYDGPDMVSCPFHSGPVCSLCCTLESRCHDTCKQASNFTQQTIALLLRLVPQWMGRYLRGTVAHFLTIMLAFSVTLLAVFYVVTFGETVSEKDNAIVWKTFVILEVLAGIVGWLLVLAHDSRRAAERETAEQTAMLQREIAAHIVTDAKLQKARDAAEAANAAKTRYLVAVSHEIRSPLNAIYGYAQLLERGSAVRADEAGSVIQQSAEHLTNLVEGLLEISRIESGVVSLSSDVVAFPLMLRHVVNMFRMQASAKGLTLELKIHDRLPSHVRTDQGRLRQILINLLSNAVKYTYAGGATVSVWYRNEVARIEVADTGIGIDPEDIERIFQPFERGAALEASHEPGIGLGLSITRVLTGVLGGELTVTSTPGQGSVFRLRMMLPVVRGATDSAIGQGTVLGYEGPTRTVLVVDDDIRQRTMLRELLVPLGFVVFTAGNGAEARDIAAREAVDLVLLDIQLVGEDGWTIASAIRQMAGAAIRIVMVSANVMDQRTRSDAASDHDGFVAKPVDVDLLLDVIRRQLGLTWQLDTRETPSLLPSAFDQAPMAAKAEDLPEAVRGGLPELRRLARQGHVRAVEALVADMRGATPGRQALLDHLEACLKQFDLKGVIRILDDAGE
ncbi:ATP-binding protein [Gluconacetobacter sp. Hr-1-5]|uniref:hybrid sensor histidine kinase/response regulator n=1 Tax=Gluconacetobacter sp. Hr-1-5 TaxID=3395370 RepID=UPI003B517AA6